MRGLNDKRVVVTGAGSGIGAATTIRLINAGARVVAGDINRNGLDKTRAAAGNPEHLECVAFDLADEGSITRLIAVAADKLGGLDGLAHIAADVSTATMGKDVEVGQMDLELWTHVLRVNLTGSALLVRETLPHLQRAGGGAIVLTSSAGAWLGERSQPAYAASKIGLHALARHTARLSGKHGIRCNVVAPGMVLTEAGATVTTQEYRDNMLSKICLPRLGQPQDLGASIAFLLSDEAGWITGQILSVDGGLMFRE